MLYTIHHYDDFLGVLEGPPGVDVKALYAGFKANFSDESLGVPKYPEWPFPIPKLEPDATGLVSRHVCCTPVPCNDPRLVAYREEANRVMDARRRLWNSRLEALRQKYPGFHVEEMFVSYLKAEYGFKDVEVEAVPL